MTMTSRNWSVISTGRRKSSPAEAKELNRSSAGTGLTVRLSFRVTEREMNAFRTVSGDSNPVHYDRDYAWQCGFTGPVVYGGLLVAQVSRLLGTRLPGSGCIWRSLDLRFRSPLYVGELAQLTGTIRHANEDLGVYELMIRIDAGRRRIADGEAAAILTRRRRHAG